MLRYRWAGHRTDVGFRTTSAMHGNFSDTIGPLRTLPRLPSLVERWPRRENLVQIQIKPRCSRAVVANVEQRYSISGDGLFKPGSLT